MPSAMPVRRRARATILSALLVAAGAVGAVVAPPASAAPQDVASATLDWGVKASFRSYVAGPIAQGSTTTDGGVASGATGFAWSAGSGTADAATSTALVSLPGSVRFQGHGGALDLTLSDARVELVSSTEGYLVFDVATKDMATGVLAQFPDTRFASIDVGGIVVGADAIAIAGAPSTLTAAGAAAFAGFYAEGTALDPVTFSLPLVAAAEPEPTDPGTEPTEPGTDPTDPGTDPTDPTDPGTDPTDPGTTPTDPGTTPAAPTAPATPTHDVAGASFAWTFHPGWLRYQEAAGEIRTDGGAVYAGPAAGFAFADGTGVVDLDDSTALVALPGSFGFLAHGGAIDVDLANVRIEVVSATQGFVVVDATSSTNGVQSNLRLATIDLAAAVFADDAVSVTGAATAITAEAAPIFTYPAGTSFGTATLALPLAAVEQPVDPTEPGTDPTEPGTDPTEPGTTEPETGLGIAGATLSWGVKASFRSYVLGPIANGTIEPGGGVVATASGFAWSNGAGIADADAGTASVAFPGQIRFTGHGGQLDLTLSDVRLRIDSATQATIVASTASRSLDSSEYLLQTGVDVATVAIALPVARADAATAIAGGTLTIVDAPAVLTEQGAAGFAGFYAAGASLDPVSATLPIAAVAQPQEPAAPVAPQQPTPLVPPIVTPSPVQTPAPAQAAGAAGQQECTATAVSGATLDWGIRSSFRSYVAGGIANGGWTTSGGVADADGGWQWSGGTGAIQADARTGLVSLPGSIHLTGHAGALDLTISDVRVRLTGPSSGTIVADLVSKGLDDGALRTYADVAFATLSFSSSVSAGALTVQGASASLTAGGAEAFAGFYAAGEALDAVTFALPLGGDVACSSATGTLPQTGADQRVDLLLPMLGLALVLMAGGLVLRRRLVRA